MRYSYKYTLTSIVMALLLLSCTKDRFRENPLTPSQEALLGTAVNFNISVADRFVERSSWKPGTKASSYTSFDNGTFNQNDLMRIYRNYWDDDNRKWSSQEAYRTYYLRYRYGAGDIMLGKNWFPEAGRQGFDDKDGDGIYDEFVQTEKDSLTWDNGSTIRFRAWSLSNYYNALRNARSDYFYPDFSIADWVSSSGPTEGIPLVLNHQGSRICFKVKAGGNEIRRVEICADINPDGSAREDGWKDYKYADNSDNTENDNSSSEAGKSDEMAKEECRAVTEIYKRMCMPAGVDIDMGTLKAVRKDRWDALSPAEVRAVEEQSDDIFMKFGQCSQSEIASDAKRPFFCNISGGHYLITIPYDMSSDGTNQGEVFCLPPYTRFRIYMYDVNNGDENNVDKYEGKYHIFTLADAKNPSTDEQAFPDGIKLESGTSYTFRVGYRYNSLYVVVDNSLSWIEQDETSSDAADQAEQMPESTTADYQWWKKAISDACSAAGTGDYKPDFKINTPKEFLEFINLVNGTAATATSGLYRLVKTYKTVIVGGQTIREPATYGWSTRNSQYNPEWIEEEEAEKMGYIFYDHYYPANADKAAYSDRDYLKGPYPFYDDNLRLNFTVTLGSDLDLKDWALESIGNAAGNPFMGCFDGAGHTLANLNLKDECLFGHIDGKAPNGAAVTNLRIESQHNICVLGTGVNPVYIAGISLLAPSSGSSIARSLSMADGVKGTSYVVGCIHVGDAGGALVASASDVNMFGCMQASSGLGSNGALVGTDVKSSFKPQVKLSTQKSTGNFSTKPSFRNFMCNYYDCTLSPSATAVSGAADDYSLLEYIRGATSDILMARNDFLTRDVPMATLIKQSNYKQYYGLAPWHAMNYAIWWYNYNRGSKHPCKMKFVYDASGYKHRYPVLVPGDLASSEVSAWNPVEQPN